MPELPEVETSRRGIAPKLVNQQVRDVIIRQPALRWPITPSVTDLRGQTIDSIQRRGKYLLIYAATGCAILHLGMSGHLRIVSSDTPFKKHDHVAIVLASNDSLRFHDPRRFGALLWTTDDPLCHPLLARLGPEPLSRAFNADYLWQQVNHSRRTIKTLIMDGTVVAGVGNIYAAEALFLASIDPRKTAGNIDSDGSRKLVQAIKHVLKQAIKAGGTTLKDFLGSDGKPGYFKQSLQVYGRGGNPCFQCRNTLNEIRLNQRNTVFCSYCQR